MRKQKKEPTPAKRLTRIGNRFHGNINLVKRASEYNNQRRIIADQIATPVSGYVAYLIVFRALQAKFEEGSKWIN